MADTYTPVLTDEEIARALNDAGVTDYADVPLRYDLEIARVIERAAIEAYQRQMWRPIETAPKDGTLILLRSRNGRIVDGIIDQVGILSWPPYIKIEPTHWMPLPPPPEAL